MTFAKDIYKNTIRKMLPKVPVYYAGYQVPVDCRFGDRSIFKLLKRSKPVDRPDYELALMEGLRSSVSASDHIVIIGAGMGVTAVEAARLTGKSGRVTCFEGSARQVLNSQTTASFAGLADRITVHHAFVAEAVRVYGSAAGATRTDPRDLPQCDVLEMDCEGAERLILAEMTIRPRNILVETHGFLGAPTGDTRALLERIGYDVADLGPAEPRLAMAEQDRDIRVLSAVRGVRTLNPFETGLIASSR